MSFNGFFFPFALMAVGNISTFHDMTLKVRMGLGLHVCFAIEGFYIVYKCVYVYVYTRTAPYVYIFVDRLKFCTCLTRVQQ